MLRCPADLFSRCLTVLFLCSFSLDAQELYPVKLSEEAWHGEERILRYHPEGNDFVISNGTRKFNRALYGTHTAFRVEAGDLPEFSMYMPGMGGNLKLGIAKGTESIWLSKAKDIKTRYTPGRMSYEIHDPLLGNSTLHVIILAMADAEGLVLKTWLEGKGQGIRLVCTFGGASGKKFSRSGDMGPDPESSFELHPEDCKDNIYQLKGNRFSLSYGKAGTGKLSGLFPGSLKIFDAAYMEKPLSAAPPSIPSMPAVRSVVPLIPGKPQYVLLSEGLNSLMHAAAAQVFTAAEKARAQIAGRIMVNTPDPYINTIGGAISIAADAIWESPSYMHGAVGWRMRLNGWRGAYAADPLGWHDRAATHLAAYARSQVLSPATGPALQDTAFHLARHLEKMGTSMFSEGYISRDPEGKNLRPHHYDMNLVYIDELIRHLNWTGDLRFARQLWPLIKRHLAWEKRNFDKDNDGLYDAYAAIWASDALYYNGGGVTHSSAYNYYANRFAARLAGLLGEADTLYARESAKIYTAMHRYLWVKEKGSFAEYRDGMGLKNLHPSAALWTVYHAIDSEVPDAIRAYQSLRYVDQEIPHIPVRAKGLKDEGSYTLATSNWMPYNWSVNNVVMAENMHTALANWQAGRNEEGFKLFRSELLADMYLGGSPGNFVQISHYDAARKEAYRDFADPIGISARALIEGLFGIVPDALAGKLTIRPGFPASWNHASIVSPDIDFKFIRKGREDHYMITPTLPVPVALKLQVKANGSDVALLIVNGKAADWKNADDVIGLPAIEMELPHAKTYDIRIVWKGARFKAPPIQSSYAASDQIHLNFPESVQVVGSYDPQGFYAGLKCEGSAFTQDISPVDIPGSHTTLIKLKLNRFNWLFPLCFELKPVVSVLPTAVQDPDKIQFRVVNNSQQPVKGICSVNGFKQELTLGPGAESEMISVGAGIARPGTNRIRLMRVDMPQPMGADQIGEVINWGIKPVQFSQRTIDLSDYFNAKVTDIFKQKYLSPRPEGPTLQLPWQGIGDWPHALATADIDDQGLRELAGKRNLIELPQGIQFSTPGDRTKQNILFSSRWDNYPATVDIPLSGKSSHAYLLMAGSTNHMQSQFDNGQITVTYTDGSSAALVLRNPETWWPVQEDYYTDGFAFRLKQPRPVRIHLKSGETDLGRSGAAEMGSDKGPEQQLIPGGAATVLDLPLDETKELKSLRLSTLANDVVIGLMGLTLTGEN